MQDTLMQIQFTNGNISFWHSSYMGDLGELFQLGNSYRYAEGKPALQLAAWIARQDVTEYIKLVTLKNGKPAVERRRGKSGGTYAHLKIMLDAASSLSPEFKDEVFEAFINMRVHILRDEGGELYKDLNATLVDKAISVLGKPAHQGHFIQIAKMVRAKILHEGQDWNTATGYQLQQRIRLEDALGILLKLGKITSWDDLKTTVTDL